MEPIKLPLSLLHNDIPASWIDVPKCSNCQNVFHKAKKVQHHPCRLACGHILCSTCLISIRKNKVKANCGQCSQKIQHKHSSEWFTQEMDYSLMGFIHYQKNIVPYMLQNVSADSKPIQAPAKVSVCVECSMTTKFICVECKDSYCERCFFKVHSAGVVFKKHQLKHSDSVSSAIGRPVGVCNSHDKQMMYYFCHTCSLPICRNCVSTTHSTHETKELVKINEAVDLTDSLKLLKNVRDTIEESKKSTVECIDKLDQYATSTAQDIFTTFQRYHTILQNLEEEAYFELKKRTVATLQQLHAVQDCFDVSGNQIAGVISNLKQFKKVTPGDVNLSVITEEIQCLLEDLAIDFDFKQFDENLFSFNASNNFKLSCDLKDLCKITFENVPFKAKMETFFTAKNICTDLDAASDYPDISSSESSIADLSARFGESTTRGRISKEPSGAQQSKRHPTIKTRQVVINEIANPKTFHVQDIDFAPQANQLIKQCNQCAMERSALTSDKIVVGEMYLVHENSRTEWHRGIVTEANKTTTLYLVDYGRHVQVMVKQIREISDELKKVQRSASTFTIRNVEPAQDNWSGECEELILQMALGNNATIIYNEDSDSGDCIVHLDYPTSVEETLLYLNYAKPRQICDAVENQLNNEMTREKKLIMEQLSNAKPFVKQAIKDECYCTVSYIVSPGQLYITSVDHMDEIDALHGKIQEFYAKPFIQKIYYPHLQMACCIFADGVWYRARIEGHRAGCVVEVYLVDVGQYLNIEWRHLRHLDNQFIGQPEGVTECSLVDIAPKDHRAEWGQRVTTELKRLCKAKLKVNVIGKKLRTVKIELYIVKKSINHQINAYLAKHQLVEWIGDTECIVERVNDPDAVLINESAMSAAITKEAAQREFRQTIKIVDYTSPSEFYVTFVKYESAIKKMHAEIQNTMKSYVAEATNSQQWKVGDNCLVNVKLMKETNKSWYRGRIESNIENNHFTVFLRDRGHAVFAKHADLGPISPSLGLVTDGTAKCHLANLKPTSSDWAQAAIAEFKFITGEECDTLAISVYGDITNESLPVYLWGRKTPIRDDAIGAPIHWTNINEVFASKGYADCTEKFKTIVDCSSADILNKETVDFNAWHEKLLSLGGENQALQKQSTVVCDEDDLILEAELDPEEISRKEVKSWLPPTPISKYYFNACPTYVDNNAVIYLHEQSQANYLKQITYTINKMIGEEKHDESYKWKENEPCMVKYHLDDCFYRGVVKEVLPNRRYKVTFVDYGNIELCEANELRIANILGDVPIQATKYYLAFVKPISADGIWNKKILEFIHVTIVNKTVAVRVEDNIDDEYVPITLTVGVTDLIKTLVAEKLAEYTSDLKVNLNLPETYDFYTENSMKSKNSNQIVRDVDLYMESSKPLDDFKQEIAKKNEATKIKEYLSKFDIDQSADFIVEDSDGEVQLHNIAHNYSFHRDSIEYDEDFKPHDSSTTISTAVKSFGLLPFKPIKLTEDVTKFPCKIYEVLDTMHLFVEPIIQEYNDRFEIMEKKIKKLFNKMRSDFDVSDTRACLAPYSADNCYYRAVINDRINKTHVRIRFVDYLNEEVVECKSLRECPPEVVDRPLKHLLIKLHGVKPSRRIRDSDIKRQLESLLGQKAVAVIVVNDTIPSVRLYDPDNSDVLVYKPLIDSKFYSETKG